MSPPRAANWHYAPARVAHTCPGTFPFQRTTGAVGASAAPVGRGFQRATIAAIQAMGRLTMKRDAIFGTIEQYRSTWERLEALGGELGEFARAHPDVKDYPGLKALQRRETLL